MVSLKIIGIIMIIAGVLLPLDFIWRVALILIGGLLAGVIGFIIALILIAVIYFKIIPAIPI
jgi:hypothetical protein